MFALALPDTQNTCRIGSSCHELGNCPQLPAPFMSWEPVVGPGGSAKEQEEPSRLHVTHQRYLFQKRLVFRHLAHQLRLDEFVMAHWRSQHDDALLHDWQTMVSSSNDCIWVQSPGSSGEILASSGCGPTAVPELRIPAMHADPGVDPHCVLDETENLQHPLWFANEIHVVKKGKKPFTFSEEITWNSALPFDRMQMSHHGIVGSRNKFVFLDLVLDRVLKVLAAMLPEGSQVQCVLRQLLVRALLGAARPSRSQRLLVVGSVAKCPESSLALPPEPPT